MNYMTRRASMSMPHLTSLLHDDRFPKLAGIIEAMAESG